MWWCFYCSLIFCHIHGCTQSYTMNQACVCNQVEKFYKNLWYINDSLEQHIKHPKLLGQHTEPSWCEEIPISYWVRVSTVIGKWLSLADAPHKVQVRFQHNRSNKTLTLEANSKAESSLMIISFQTTLQIVHTVY